jgi:carboxylesterase type B
VFGPDADAVLTRYPWPSPSDQFSAPYQIGAVMTDSGQYGIGGCPNRALTRSLAQHTATWAYEFDHRAGPGLAPIPGYEWGAGHAAELAYLFPGFDNGTPIAPTFDADEQRLAEEMKLSWTAFTSSGDPRGGRVAGRAAIRGGRQCAGLAGRRAQRGDHRPTAGRWAPMRLLGPSAQAGLDGP